MADGPLHDELMSLGRDLASQGAISSMGDILPPQTGMYAPDPFSGVYQDDFANRYAAQIQANAMVNASAFAERARQDSLRRSSGDLISDAGMAVGWIAGNAVGGQLGGFAGSMAGSMLTEELLKGFGFYDRDPLVSLNDQAQAMVDDSVLRLAWSAGGLGLDRGISIDAAREIGGGLTDIAKASGLHGVEASRVMSALEPYAGNLQLSGDPKALADQLEDYMQGVIDLVQRTNTSFERATQLVAQGAMMGVSAGNAGAMYEGIYNYSNMAGMDPNAVLNAGIQAATPFSGTGFGYGGILSATAANMGAAALADMGSSNIPLWAAAGGPEGFGMHMSALGSNFASNPMMWGRMMGGGSFNHDAWQTVLSGGTLPDDFGNAYSDMNANDRLVAQYQGLQEIMFRPNEWSRAAMGSIMGAFAEDDITDPRAIAMGLVHHGYAPNQATGRLMESEFRKMASPTYDMGNALSAQYSAASSDALSEVNRISDMFALGSTASAIQNETGLGFWQRVRSAVGIDQRSSSVLQDALNRYNEERDTSYTMQDTGRAAEALALYAVSDRGISSVLGEEISGSMDSVRRIQAANVDSRTGHVQYTEETWNDILGVMPDEQRALFDGLATPGDRIGWGGRRGTNIWEAFSEGQEASGIKNWLNVFPGYVNLSDQFIAGAGTGVRQGFDFVMGANKPWYWNAPAAGLEALGIIDRTSISDPSRQLVQVDPQAMQQAMYELEQQATGGIGRAAQFLPGYQGNGLPLDPMIDYAMRNNANDMFSNGQTTVWADKFARSMADYSRASSMYNTDQVDARLNYYESSAGFNAGWKDFLDSVNESGATFMRTNRGIDADYNSFVQRIYGSGHQASDQERSYINTYLGMNNDFSQDSVSSYSRLQNLSVMDRDTERYQSMMERVTTGTGLSEERVSQIALYGHYQMRLASGDFESDAEETSVRNAVSDMQLSDPTLIRSYATHHGSIASIARSNDNMMYLAASGNLEERAAITESVWNRSSQYARDLTGGIDYDELISMTQEEAQRRFGRFSSADLDSYGGGFADIIEKLKSGEDVTSSDIMALQEFADFHNPDTGGEAQAMRDGSSEDAAMYVQLAISSVNQLIAGITKGEGELIPVPTPSAGDTETPTGNG